MIAIPIGPRTQKSATAASPAYLAAHGRPVHPRDLLEHACIRHRFLSGAAPGWEFSRHGELVRIAPSGPLVATSTDLQMAAAIAGLGVLHTFEEFLAPAVASGALERILEDWDDSFPGPYLYYPSRRHMPAPLRAFVDFVKAWGESGPAPAA
jgi:DNA-binding transcriptional LysR family regulator